MGWEGGGGTDFNGDSCILVVLIIRSRVAKQSETHNTHTGTERELERGVIALVTEGAR